MLVEQSLRVACAVGLYSHLVLLILPLLQDHAADSNQAGYTDSGGLSPWQHSTTLFEYWTAVSTSPKLQTFPVHPSAPPSPTGSFCTSANPRVLRNQHRYRTGPCASTRTATADRTSHGDIQRYLWHSPPGYARVCHDGELKIPESAVYRGWPLANARL